jgi:phosphoenolpyruvate---glycerone phosphotransferase subunit DhaM
MPTTTNPRSRKEESLVGLVLVSHSEQLVEGLRAIVAQFGGSDVPIGLAGGTDDGRIGTTAPRIETAIRTVLADGADGALVLLDFGSALLSLEIALESLEPELRSRVRISDGPLVEGAFLAGVQASTGADLDEVAEAARGWRSLPKVPEA